MSMEVSGIGRLICTVILVLTALTPVANADDDLNQSVSVNADDIQEIPLRSIVAVSSDEGDNPESAQSSEAEKTVRSFSLESESSVPRDMDGLEWQNLSGGMYGDALFDIQPAGDGNYIGAGGTGSHDFVSGFSGYVDAWVMKTDPAGNTIWKKSYGSSGFDQAMSIRQTNDMNNAIGYIFAGYSNSTEGNFTAIHGKEDGWVVKLDKDGNVKWQTLLGGTGTDWLMSVRQIPDRSGYIVAGYTESTEIENAGSYHGDTDIFAAKLDANGTVVWQKVFGGSNYDFGSSIIPAVDGGYILAGYTRSESISNSNSNHGYNDIVVMKLSEDGVVEWSKLYGGYQGEITTFDNVIQQTSDDEYILVGQTISSHGSYGAGDITEYTHGSADVWVVKLDKDGNIKWQNLLGGSGYDEGSVIQQTSHGDYIIAGSTTSDNSGDVGKNNGGWDTWVAKVDANGQFLWQDTLGGSGYDQCTAIQPMPDEGFILAVYTRSSDSGNIGTNHGYEDTWLAKLKPRLVVDVEDSNSHSWVPNTTVFLHDMVNKTDRNLTAVINGRVVFTGSDESNQFPLVKGRNYTVRSVADNYYNNSPREVTFTQDGLLVNLSQQPKYVSTNKSFSITCIEHYDYICGNDGICSLSGSFDECDNAAKALIGAGYTMNFYYKDGEVTEKDFATDSSYAGDNITESAFHYHTGHGTDSVIAGTYLNLKDSKITWLPGIPPIPVRTGGYVDAGKVEKKWGGKTKWVMLQSCNILKDENWGKALSTSHGILGYSTPTGVNSSFSSVFFNYALDKNKKMTIVSAYKQATLDTWHDDNITAAVITRTKEQYDKDQFPGIGDLTSDGDTKNNGFYIKHWTCRSGIEW